MEETDYKLVVRCQINTSQAKTDSVIAYDPSGKNLVFIKGPFKDDSAIDDCIKFQFMKKEKGLPYLNYGKMYLTPNRWKSVPLGVRNKLDLSKAWPFMICECIFSEDAIQTKVANSKYWKDEVVLDTKKMRLTIDPFHLTPGEFKDYVDAIQFRIDNGIGDFADRNFIRGKDGRIYSVDEEKMKEVVDPDKKREKLMCQLKKKRYRFLVGVLTF